MITIDLLQAQKEVDMIIPYIHGSTFDDQAARKNHVPEYDVYLNSCTTKTILSMVEKGAYLTSIAAAISGFTGNLPAATALSIAGGMVGLGSSFVRDAAEAGRGVKIRWARAGVLTVPFWVTSQ
ncbi:hypothetical protein [Brevibacillus dissolubilis]|uniref:hypothetical protein n=1 Tax=Brevibacillus dissolubilis TaxID=1844116 RepID=UPI001116D678|nr:hypothetical protein [Brevibacillus dissolubilis]